MLNQTSREVGFDFTYTPFKDKSTLRNVEFVFGKNKWNWLNPFKHPHSTDENVQANEFVQVIIPKFKLNL